MRLKSMAGILAAAAVFVLATAMPTHAQSFLISPKGEKKWMEYFYRANGEAPAPKPSTLIDGGIGFVFTTTPDVALFMTGHPGYNQILLGDLSGKSSVYAAYTVNAGISAFNYYGQGTPSNPCGALASVRLYFSTNNNDLGESQYWWSNPTGLPLASGPGILNASFDPSQWSDRDGHSGTFDAAHTAAFNAAKADVQHMGLSFGGGCFFANGVGNASGTATFVLNDFSVN